MGKMGRPKTIKDGIRITAYVPNEVYLKAVRWRELTKQTVAELTRELLTEFFDKKGG